MMKINFENRKNQEAEFDRIKPHNPKTSHKNGYVNGKLKTKGYFDWQSYCEDEYALAV